jgi:2-polyprenyl-6-methoxyphenol hydroxylase-like FAD-dependent oxidoreductase
LKVALLLGSHIQPFTELRAIRAPVVELESEGNITDFNCDVLVGADGEHSIVAELAGFEMKTFRAGFAIGITANFVNSFTTEELGLEEFGFISYARQEFFNGMKEKYQIELENLVYYREATHYFVMTATKDSLLKRGVLRNDVDMSQLLSDENVDKEELQAYVKDVALSAGLAHSDLVIDSRGLPDAAIFDFTKKDSCLYPSKLLDSTQGQKKLVVCMIGDALVAPFWPLGTGANRAVLSALDTAHFLTQLTPNCNMEECLKEHSVIFKKMENSAPDTLTDCYSKWTIEPETRYKKHGLLA